MFAVKLDLFDLQSLDLKLASTRTGQPLLGSTATTVVLGVFWRPTRTSESSRTLAA